MPKTKAFTITVQNQPGAVAAIAKALGSANINILALSGTAHAAGPTVHLVAENAKRARKVLDAAKFEYEETRQEQVELANRPGALAQHLEKLAANGVNLSSIHATAVKGKKKAVVIYTVEAPAKPGDASAPTPPASPGIKP